MRLDKFLKIARVIKRRTVANEAADSGRVFVNGKQAKPSYEVKLGDIVEIKFGDKVSKFEIIKIPKVQGKDMGELIKKDVIKIKKALKKVTEEEKEQKNRKINMVITNIVRLLLVLIIARGIIVKDYSQIFIAILTIALTFYPSILEKKFRCIFTWKFTNYNYTIYIWGTIFR